MVNIFKHAFCYCMVMFRGHDNTHQQKKPVTRLDGNTLNDLRKKGLCFKCREPWSKDHICTKGGKMHQIEYYSAEESGTENSNQQSDLDEKEEEEPQREVEKGESKECKLA